MTVPSRKDLEAWLQHEDGLRRLAHSLAADASLGDDALQTMWLKALQSGPSDSARALPWLRAVLRNAVFGQHRTEMRRSDRDARSAAAQSPSPPDEVVERAEFQQQLMAEVLRLAEPYRSTLLLRYSEEQTTGDIATLQAVSNSTVRGRLKTGLDLLRERLGRRHPNAWRQLCLAVALPLTVGTAAASAPPIRSAKLATPQLVAAVALPLIAGIAWILVGFPGDRSIGETGASELAATAPPSGVAEAPGAAAPLSGVERDSVDLSMIAPAAVFRGRVVADESGEALSGVEVRVVPSYTELIMFLDRLNQDWEPPAPVYTSEDGRFEILFGETPGTFFTIELTAKNRVLSSARIGSPLAAPRVNDMDEIRLLAGEEVLGTVTSVGGEPISDARITLYGLPRTRSSFAGSAGELEATSDLEGGVAFESSVPAGTYRAEIRAPGYFVQEIAALEIRPDAINDFAWTCSPAPSISGVVRDLQGSPVAGVVLYGRDSGDEWVGKATTEDDGQFSLHADRPGITCERIRAEVGVIRTVVEGPFEWGRSDLSLDLARARSMEIEVREAGTGLPVSEFSVICQSTEHGKRSNKSTRFNAPRLHGHHEGGRLTVGEIWDGPHALLVIPTTGWHVVSDWIDFDGDALSKAPFVVEVERLIEIEVEVTLGEGGPPASEAHVALTDQSLESFQTYGPSSWAGRYLPWESWTGKHPQLLSMGSTGVDGRVRLKCPSGMSGGALVTIGLHSVRASFSSHSTGGAPIQLVIPVRAMVQGHLAHPRTANRSVQIVFDNTAETSARRPPSAQRIYASAEGDYSIRLPAGTYTMKLQYRLQRGSGEFQRMHQVDLPMEFGIVQVPESGVIQRDIDASHLAEGELHGNLSRSGKPLANQRFSISHRFPDGSSIRSLLPKGDFQTDAAGRFSFTEAPPGDYRFSIFNGREEEKREVLADSGWVFTLSPGESAEWDVELLEK